MSTTHSDAHCRRWIAVGALAVLALPWSLVHAGRVIDEHRAAEPQGEVEIFNLSGTVEVDGWDRNEVAVTGTAGENVERVDVMTAGSRTSIHVISRSSMGWGSNGEAHLVVHVPGKSAVTATLVSADFKVSGILGDLKLQAVSGNVTGDAGGNVRASTVSGEVRLTARAAKAIEIKTISGDIHLTGGGGEVDITTVSGKATLDFGEVSRARFKSVSGEITSELALAADGQLEGESVSGDVSLKFAAAPAAEFDVESFSGDISNCFGPKPLQSRYGPGSRLSFKNGEGHGNVRIETKSGDVKLCTKGAGGSHTSSLSLAQVSRPAMVVPYVF
jgi:putative adhesin